MKARSGLLEYRYDPV
ncbi:hypothetical protein [Shinella sp. DD12]|nr:hypothetical protein [Shinella sp. DD12]